MHCYFKPFSRGRRNSYDFHVSPSLIYYSWVENLVAYAASAYPSTLNYYKVDITVFWCQIS